MEIIYCNNYCTAFSFISCGLCSYRLCPSNVTQVARTQVNYYCITSIALRCLAARKRENLNVVILRLRTVRRAYVAQNQKQIVLGSRTRSNSIIIYHDLALILVCACTRNVFYERIMTDRFSESSFTRRERVSVGMCATATAERTTKYVHARNARGLMTTVYGKT